MTKAEAVKELNIERIIGGIVLFIITAVMGWVATTIGTQTASLNKQSLEIALLTQNVSRLEKQVDVFTTKPRFTREDYQLEMKLYDSRLSFIELELRKRTAFMDDVEARLRSLEKQ